MLDGFAGVDQQACAANGFARRHALHERVHRRNHDGGSSIPAALCEPRQRRQPRALDIGLGRKPIVGEAIPGREAQHLEIGRKERDRLDRRLRRQVVSRHEEQETASARGGLRCEPRVVTGGRAGERQPALGPRNVIQTFHVGCFRSQIAFRRPNTAVS